MGFPVIRRSDVAMPASSAGIAAWLTLIPIPTITNRTWLGSAYISVRMPPNFFPLASRSFGQRRSAATPVSSCTASLTASPATRVITGATIGEICGRSSALI